MASNDFQLVPATDVEQVDGRFVALTDDPWLDLEGRTIGRLPGRLVAIRYRLSLLDEPARPVFRFWLSDDRFAERIGVGPICGAGVWVGRVPAGTRRVSVSPTNRRGPFSFAIESISSRSWIGLLAVGVLRVPRAARSALLTRLIGWRPEADNNLAWAIGSFPLPGRRAWWSARERPLDPEGFDGPRFDWANAVDVIVIVDATDADLSAIRDTVASLLAQGLSTWSALLVGASSDPTSDPRVRCVALSDVEGRLASHRCDALVGWLEAGDTLVPHALAYLAEQAHRDPLCRLFYADETRDGRPLLKPGWSRRLETARPYLGRAVFLRSLAEAAPADRDRFLRSGIVSASLIGSYPPGAVKPLRRILVRGPTRDDALREAYPPPPRRRGTASIIIPSKNHPALLARVIASIRAKSPRGGYTIVVADNGSTSAEALAMLATLRDADDAVVVDHPGPFNFSEICNAAAAASTGDVLVFLNDDTEVLSEGWLERLVDLALDETVGAVGVKLTYPDGRLQHVGVLVGMGDSAGHFGAFADGGDPGWAHRNEVVHEVSAVTGACLAVSRRKFEAVGGLDADNLPIELSDIDLCLKLNARGWQTVVDPGVHLMHEESVSRGGATLRRLDVYAEQRAIFVERWRSVLRDDPVFHPGLSLYNLSAALG